MVHTTASGITNSSAMLSVDEAMVGFRGAARQRVVFRAKPTRQGVQLPAVFAHYNNFVGGIDHTDQWWPVVHPAGALHVLMESEERFVRGG